MSKEKVQKIVGDAVAEGLIAGNLMTERAQVRTFLTVLAAELDTRRRGQGLGVAQGMILGVGSVVIRLAARTLDSAS